MHTITRHSATGDPAVSDPAVNDPAAVPLERLEAHICSLAANLAASTCEWLRLVAEFDRRKGWTGWGIKSCAHWLAWSCSVSPQAAREYLRVARTLEEMPLVSAAFAAGRLSYSKVKAITRVASRIDEQTLLDQALLHTAAQLDRLVRSFRRTDSAGAGRLPERSARWFYDDDGTFVLTARLTAADGAVVLAALQMAEQSLEPDAGQPDALVALADIALAAGPVDSSGDDRHLVVVHVDADAEADTAKGRCHLEDGPGLQRSAAERLMCDAAVVAVVAASLGADDTGEPLRLGRKTRKISPALRRALRIHDGGCRHPGCHRRRFLEAHHVVHWKDGGPTDLDNLVLLCRFHHLRIHEQHFTVSLAPSGWLFRRPDGIVIPAVRDLTPGPDKSLPPAVLPERAEAQGERFHLAESVSMLCRAADEWINPLAWLDGGSPNDNGKRLDQQIYAGMTDAEIRALLYPASSQQPDAGADNIDTGADETDYGQFDTFDELLAFCRASVFGSSGEHDQHEAPRPARSVAVPPSDTAMNPQPDRGPRRLADTIG